MSEDTQITVEVAYALPDRQALLTLTVPEGTTALEAVQRSSISKQFPELTLDDSSPLGIFGQAVPASQQLREGDRVEIYRPLLADPKDVRKARAARVKARRASQAGGEGEGEGEAPGGD